MDERLRRLERAALQGDNDSLERLKAEWLRAASWRECWLCKSRVPVLGDKGWKEHNEDCLTALQARNREKKLKEGETRYYSHGNWIGGTVPITTSTTSGVGGGVTIVPVPIQGPVATRARKEPIWLRSGNGFKSIESNVSHAGDSCYLSYGQLFYWYACSLLPDIETPKPQLERLFNEGQLSFCFQTSTLFTLPCSTIMAKPDSYSLENIADIPRTNVTISEKPVELQSQEWFRVRLHAGNASLDIDTPLTFVLYGIWCRPITS